MRKLLLCLAVLGCTKETAKETTTKVSAPAQRQLAAPPAPSESKKVVVDTTQLPDSSRWATWYTVTTSVSVVQDSTKQIYKPMPAIVPTLPFGPAELSNDSLCASIYTATIDGIPLANGYPSVAARNAAMQPAIDSARRCGKKVYLRIPRKSLRDSVTGYLSVARAVKEVRSWPKDWDTVSAIAGLHLGDDPADGSWGGTMKDRLEKWDSIACAAKTRFPSRPRLLRARPVQMAQLGHRYSCMTTAMAQYNARLGDPVKFFQVEALSAKNQGLGFVTALNLLAGGCGTGAKYKCYAPGTTRAGAETGTFQMSAAEVGYIGAASLAEASVCGWLSWTASEAYRKDFYTIPENQAALQGLSLLASKHAVVPCNPT